MTRRIARAVAGRVAVAVAVLLGAATVAFFAVQLIPGDPVSALLGPSTTASPEVRASIRRDLALDRPVVEQYLRFISRLARGDLGRSYQLQRPVIDLLAEQYWPTVQLALAALAVALVVAICSALGTAGRRPVRRAIASSAELVAVSVPSFWLGILLLAGFSFRLHWFPVAGAQSWRSLVLPAVTLGIPSAGVLGQTLREAMESALDQPFITSARARGLGEHAVRVRHAFRHAALGLTTLTGWLTGSLLGGAVLVETVFGRPGLGAITLQAVSSRDMPVVTGVVLLAALTFVTISTLVDLLAVAIDPRLRRETVPRRAPASAAVDPSTAVSGA